MRGDLERCDVVLMSALKQAFAKKKKCLYILHLLMTQQITTTMYIPHSITSKIELITNIMLQKHYFLILLVLSTICLHALVEFNARSAYSIDTHHCVMQ